MHFSVTSVTSVTSVAEKRGRKNGNAPDTGYQPKQPEETHVPSSLPIR